MKILIAILLIANAKASIPTPEGLFKNGNNKNPTGSIIIFDFMIEEFKSKGRNDSGRDKQTGFYRLYIGLENEDVKSLLQVNYKGSSMEDRDALSVYHFPNFKRVLFRETSVERKLFYSLLMMITANSSSFLSAFVGDIDPQYQSNKDLMNREKINLYKRYKSYLERRARGSAFQERALSPLNPSDRRQRSKVNEIINAPTYLRSKHISLIRRGETFFWKLALANITFFFTNEEHRFSEVVYHNSARELNIRTGSYSLLDGVHELPKEIIVSSFNGKIYRVRSLELKHTNGRRKMIEWTKSSRIKRIQEAREGDIIPLVF